MLGREEPSSASRAEDTRVPSGSMRLAVLVLAEVACPTTALRGVWKRLIGVTEKASLRGLTAHHLERCETLVAARFPRTWKAW
jgi:hypothetical protein